MIIPDSLSFRYTVSPPQNPFPGAPVLFAEATGSTMEDAEVLLKENPFSGTVFAAGFQTRGVGRVPGRSWHGAEGESLLFSIIVDRKDVPLPPQTVPLAAGLGLSRFLEKDILLLPSIKWPNDVLMGGRKIAGILCRYKHGRFIIGIGLNVNQASFPPDLQNPATSLYLETGVSRDPLSLLPDLLTHLRCALSEAGWKEEVSLRLYGIGKTFTVREGGAATVPAAGAPPDGYLARILGIDEEGRLLMAPLGGLTVQALTAAEISIREM